MKIPELRRMIKAKAVDSIWVMRSEEMKGWMIEFHMSWKMFSNVEVEAARGGVRFFKTLDAVERFLSDLFQGEVVRFEVISARHGEVQSQLFSATA